MTTSPACGPGGTSPGTGAVLDAAPTLLACMNDVEAQVRAACVEAFGQFGALPVELHKRAAMTLARVMADGRYEVRLEVLRAVERLLRNEVLGGDEQAHCWARRSCAPKTSMSWCGGPR